LDPWPLSQYIPTSTTWTPRGEAQGALEDGTKEVGSKGHFLHENHGFYARYYGEIPIFPKKPFNHFKER
jgi:hypothetical protein